MKISSVEFVKSVVSVDQIPGDGLPEVAFAGRSNVGKSSLINRLLNRKKIAKTSSSPGKTRQLNYFKVNDKFYFVDLPGYGFARVSKSEKIQWQQLIEAFITQSENLKAVAVITDSRIGPTSLDLQLIGWLRATDVPVILIATKCDKLSRSAVAQLGRRYHKELSKYQIKDLIPFSALSGVGKKELSTAILSKVGQQNAS